MKPQPPRTPSTLSDSVHHQLNMYAIAASAAGVGMLALAQPAEAKVVYTKTHHIVGRNGTYGLDLNHDGVVDFLIQQSSQRLNSCGTYSCLGSADLRANGASGNAIKGSKHFASALKAGAVIGPRQHFSTGGETMARVFCSDFCATYGKWLNVDNHYLGLKFKIKGKIHYGWARLSVYNQRINVTATLTGYAYETIPNKAIIAGKTKGADVITVQPASLGRLAQGSAGLAAWRLGK